MISRMVRWQLVVFTILTVTAVVYASIAYIGLPRLLGFGQYRLAVELPETGGLYPNAVVTLRGVEIGKVTGMRLSPDGVIADLSVDDGVRIPADSDVAVRNTSAIGEQYLSFVPSADKPPYFSDGATVSGVRVTLPTQIGSVLHNTKALADSVPQDKLGTTIDELYNAFNGTGQTLQQFLDSARTLTTAASDNLGPTRKLIADLVPVLDTQKAEGPDIAAYTANLASFTEQLKMSDPQIRAALTDGPGFATELGSLLDGLRPTVPRLLASLTSTGQMLDIYLPNVAQVLSILPATVNNTVTSLATSPVPNTAVLNLKTAINSPTACTKGFNAQARDPSDTTSIPAPGDSYCKIPQNSPQLVRGARNSPCPNDPARRSATAAGCGLNFLAGGGVLTTPTPSGSTTYDPVTGLFLGPDGKPYILDDLTRGGAVPSLASLLDPLALAPARAGR
ncbi:MAG TPA: MlaD family protein [Amycolatopsis sp.]|nr:MlaD family protein [Amycolatopsis sp.]